MSSTEKFKITLYLVAIFLVGCVAGGFAALALKRPPGPQRPEPSARSEPSKPSSAIPSAIMPAPLPQVQSPIQFVTDSDDSFEVDQVRHFDSVARPWSSVAGIFG